MIYLKLAFVFFKIGLFSFGGGYAMIPLIHDEIIANQWIGEAEFADIVAVSQMTPGPIAVNAATYVGFRTAGVLGSAAATFGVAMPSFIIIVLIAIFLQRFKSSKLVENTLRGIRPVTIGLMGSGVYFFATMSFLDFSSKFYINPRLLVIFILVLIGAKRFKIGAIPLVIASAVLGILLGLF